MTAQEMEKLLADVTPGEWLIDACTVNSTLLHPTEEIANVLSNHGNYIADLTLIAMAPELARRVIASEKLAEALRCYANGHGDDGILATDALAEWDAAQ